MERLADKQAFMSSQMRSSCRHLAAVIIKYVIWEKGIYMLNFYSPRAAIFFKRVPHCLSPHDRSPFTTECFILPQLSLVVWQKNWKSTDYVYFQNRAYQSVIRPLWCSLFIFAANDPCNICPFPPDVLFSIKARLFGILCVGYMCVGGGEGVWYIFQMIWMTLLNNYTIFRHKDTISLHFLSLEHSRVLTSFNQHVVTVPQQDVAAGIKWIISSCLINIFILIMA